MLFRPLVKKLLSMLTRLPRCFGDKGDVEDITEGKINLLTMTLKAMAFSWT